VKYVRCVVVAFAGSAAAVFTAHLVRVLNGERPRDLRDRLEVPKVRLGSRRRVRTAVYESGAIVARATVARPSTTAQHDDFDKT
jgi:hypothetical protein